MYNVLHFYWTGFALIALLLNHLILSIINFQTILTGIRRSRIFFNQTSKQLIFIEHPFGVEPTIGFLCWFRMLLLSCLVFIFGKITISSSHNFAHSRVLSICTLPKRRNKLPLRVTGLHLTTSLKIAGHRGLSIKECSDNWISCWTRPFAISTLSFTIDSPWWFPAENQWFTHFQNSGSSEGVGQVLPVAMISIKRRVNSRAFHNTMEHYVINWTNKSFLCRRWI